MIKLWQYLVNEKTNKSTSSLPEFTSTEVKEIQQNIHTFKSSEAKQYVISTLARNQKLASTFADLTQEEMTVLGSMEKQLSSNSKEAGKWTSTTTIAGGDLTTTATTTPPQQSPAAMRAHAMARTQAPGVSTKPTPASAPSTLTSPSTHSQKPRPQGSALKRDNNPGDKTITKKDSSLSILSMNAEVQEEMARDNNGLNSAAITAALQNLQSSGDDEDYGTVRIKLDSSTRDDDEEDNFGTMRIVSGGGDEEDFGTTRFTVNGTGGSGSGSGEDKPLPKVFAYREPEEWEKNIVALTRGEWAEGMSEEAFKRWKGKERRGLGSMFVATKPQNTL